MHGSFDIVQSSLFPMFTTPCGQIRAITWPNQIKRFQRLFGSAKNSLTIFFESANWLKVQGFVSDLNQADRPWHRWAVNRGRQRCLEHLHSAKNLFFVQFEIAQGAGNRRCPLQLETDDRTKNQSKTQKLQNRVQQTNKHNKSATYKQTNATNKQTHMCNKPAYQRNHIPRTGIRHFFL